MTRTCFVLILAISLGAAGGQKPCPQPLWAVDLTSMYQFRDFGLMKNPRNRLAPNWTNEQGIEFISPQVLVVYQVSEADNPQPTSRKEESGGSGRYVLHMSFLDVTKGNELKALRLVTDGWSPSRVFPTHNGRSLVRTGETVRSLSETFDEIAIAHLPHSKTATGQWSEVSISSSGRLVYVKYNASYSSQFVRGTAVVDADSLDPVEEVPHGDVTLGEGRPGFTFVPKVSSCPSKLASITPEVFVGYGCKELKLFSPDGQLLWNIPMHDEVVSVRGGGKLFAASIQRYRMDPLDIGFAPEPLRIDVYDLATKSEKCSIPSTVKSLPERWPTMSYALSASGAAAVIQGNILSVYQP
jgi:hypothetical protein